MPMALCWQMLYCGPLSQLSKKSIQYILLVYLIYKIYMTYPARKRLDFFSEMSTLYGRDTYLIE